MRGRDLFWHARNKNVRLQPRGRLAQLAEAAAFRLGPLLASRSQPVFTERVVEYPFVFRALPPPPARVLDFGAYEDLLPLHLASLGYDVVARDVRGYPFPHPRVTVDRRDVFEGAGEAEYDAVVSVSTIEHVGLPDSGGRVEPDGDRRCVELLLRALRPGGVLVATVPFGAAVETAFDRIYDLAALARVFPGADVTVFARGPSGAWTEADPREAERRSYSPGGWAWVSAVACLVVTR
ncbi:MAG TPA: DUF268 domain-containing protein [Gaiellaceae bacterium]|nr:DUF268 domain-containing protein [Gaiellaceae bacterium]